MNATRIKFTYTSETDGASIEEELEVPAVYEVCGTCEGEGTTVDPQVDGNGITSSEWSELDVEDRQDYVGGRYDVQCSECKGLRVVPVVDAKSCSLELLMKYREWEAEQDSSRGSWRDDPESVAERRFGA